MDGLITFKWIERGCNFGTFGVPRTAIYRLDIIVILNFKFILKFTELKYKFIYFWFLIIGFI